MRSGDTLSGIAQRNGMSVAQVLALNPQIADPNVIRIGDAITLVGSCLRSGNALRSWSAVDLGSPLGGPTYPTGINDRGEIVFLAYPPSETWERAYLWRDGVTTDLGTLGGPTTIAWDLNDRGQVACSSLTESMEQHACIWQDGAMTELASGSSYSDALDINDRGEVVGAYATASAGTGAFLWRDGVLTDLGTLGGDYARAEVISERGQVAGQSRAASGEMHAFLWDTGSPERTIGGSSGETARWSTSARRAAR